MSKNDLIIVNAKVTKPNCYQRKICLPSFGTTKVFYDIIIIKENGRERSGKNGEGTLTYSSARSKYPVIAFSSNSSTGS